LKKIYITIYFFFAITFALPVFVNGQTFEKNPKESSEEFVKRIFPSDVQMQFKAVENKFGSPGKKIVFFYKKIKTDTSMNANEKVACIYVNILIPENESSNKYSMQTLLVGCNKGYDVKVEDAYPNKDKQQNSVLSILFCQLNRASTRLLLKNYKTFFLKQASENNFTVEEIKD
jgi:hypothetical protein